MTREKRLRQQLRLAVADLVSSLLYYDRKEDEDLDRDDIDDMFRNEWITNAEIVTWFREELEKVHAEPSGGHDG